MLCLAIILIRDILLRTKKNLPLIKIDHPTFFGGGYGRSFLIPGSGILVDRAALPPPAYMYV